MIRLNDLPREHPARNKPLGANRARYKFGKGGWKVVEPTYKIANNTYNELAPCWTLGWDWEIEHEQ